MTQITESPFYKLTGSYNCKLQDLEMSQNVIAPAAWMLAVYKYRPITVIEIGTCKGGLSSLISQVTNTYGGRFHTMDVRCGGDTNRYPLFGEAVFHNWNCFEHEQEIADWIKSEGITFVLCDGGNKPKEFDTFSKYLKPGDVIACHDYRRDPHVGSDYFWAWIEVTYAAIENAVKQNNLALFENQWFENSAWCVMRKQYDN